MKTKPQTGRVVWAFPSFVRGYYHQPVLSAFINRFPETVVMTGAWPGFLPGMQDKLDIRIRTGIRWTTWKWGRKQIGFTWASPAVVKELFQLRPDVLVTCGFNVFTVIGLLLKWFRGTQMVVIWEGISPTIARLNSPFRLSFRRKLAAFVDGAICNSKEGADYLVKVLRIPSSRLVCHPCEVPDRSSLQDTGHPIIPLVDVRHPVFLYVAQLIPRKGWRYLLQAAHLLTEHGIRSFSVIIAGQGPDLAELEQMVTGLGLSDIVHIVGQVPYKHLGDYFRSADVFVLPTLEDVWGMVVLEAMAFGKPILCSRHAGSKELVRDGTNGFVFEPTRPQQLYEYMLRFIQRPDLIQRFGQASEEIISPYTPEKAAAVIADMIDRVVRLRTHRIPVGNTDVDTGSSSDQRSQVRAHWPNS